MKAIIFLIGIFFAVGCSGQKSNFHAQNKASRYAYGMTTISSSTTCDPIGSNTTFYFVRIAPQVGDVVYTTSMGGAKFVGDGNWYYISSWGTSYQIDSHGNIIAIFAC